jgi:glutamate-5-semialdehyde dehydrogenase
MEDTVNSINVISSMKEYNSIFESVREASRSLGLLEVEKTNKILNDVAEAAIAEAEFLLEENQKDLERMDPEDPKYDRLKLTVQRIEGIANDIRTVAKLESPLGITLSEVTRPNGLEIKKISVPLGVIGIIYEARPNVTFDVFSLCLKSGNTCILKGGSDAIYSNTAIMRVIHKVLEANGINKNIVQLLSAGRDATEALLNAVNYVDVIIPRGSQGLIDFVRQNAKVPVIETGAGIVHTYFDETGDVEKGKAIIKNAKTRRVSVCNALDCLIINERRLERLYELVQPLEESDVIIYADEPSYQVLADRYPSYLLEKASPEHYGIEFLSYKMSIKTVKNLNEALDHIARFSSKHSEAIISENDNNIDRFLKSVDASAVYANTSTAYTDGAQFGLGAEIGISTQKIHARGPMGLNELTSYKYLVKGNGQVRP